GQGTAHISALPAGVYTVTVSDVNLCTKIQSWLITQPFALSGNGVTTPITCYGGSNGTASISGLGGVAPYTYLWSNGSSDQLITGLMPGRFYVTITDANNCSRITWQDVLTPSQINITGTVSKVTSHGGNDGMITTTVSGGTAAYSYLWNNNQQTPTAVNLSAGTYTITVTDASTCSMSQIFEVSEIGSIIITQVARMDPSCYSGNNGYITVSASGGEGSYQYSWSSPGGNTPSLTGLGMGSYTVTVTDENNDSETATWSLTSPSPFTMVPVITNVMCHGGNTGEIELVASGGTTPYAYNWSSNVEAGQRTSAIVTGLAAGGYLALGTDAHSCTARGIYFVTQPEILSGNGAVTNTTCSGGNNGVATIQGTGGTYPYSYIWSTGSTAQMISGLTAGRYYVTITDANNCVATTSKDITSPSEMSITCAATAVSCSGSNGQITTTVCGGSGGPYTYLWSNGQTGSTAVNLTAGTYTVTVTNAAGCTAVSAPITVEIILQQVGQAGPITGASVVGNGQSDVPFSVEPIENATGYIWTLPPGASITGGLNTRSIKVMFSMSAVSGVITVRGVNICGIGLSSSNHEVTLINLDLIVQNSLPMLWADCYNAIRTIYVAGFGSTFIVDAPGSATMIAGQRIIYLPGTTVNAGGYMHGYITTNEQYCATLFNPVVNTPAEDDGVQTLVPELITNQHVRAYPNPTSGLVTLELTGTNETGMTTVGIYGMNGVMVLSADLGGKHKHTLSVESLCPGIYFIHVMTGSGKETLKLIKM
ncbi:MAG: T9SS type A sorting domain-containing protein, partial [Bacteroidota bacterium]